jgi:hypothetical protein
VFGCVAYAKVPDERRSKLDAKATKCLMLGYCEGTKAYRLICLETKKIIKSPDVTFFEDKKALEECPSGREVAPVFMVDESSKACDEEDVASEGCSKEEKKPNGGSGSVETPNGGSGSVEQPNGGSGSVEQPNRRSGSLEQPNRASGSLEQRIVEDERFGEDGRYPTRMRRPLGEWWKNHIFPQEDEDQHANVAITKEPKTFKEAMQSPDASKWEQAMQEEYDSLIANGT